MNQLAIGVPDRPRTPAASGWLSAICPFPLNVVSTGACRRSVDPAVRRRCFRAFLRRQRLHIIGEDQMGCIALDQRVLAGQGHQFGGFGRMQHRLAEACDRCECGCEIDFLKRARSQHLHVDLAGECEQRGAVDFRIPAFSSSSGSCPENSFPDSHRSEISKWCGQSCSGLVSSRVLLRKHSNAVNTELQTDPKVHACSAA